MFRAKRNDEALAVVKRMAGESQSRNLAAGLEYAYLSKQPVSDASVRAWQAFLERYPRGRSPGASAGAAGRATETHR
ncbi:cellulose synthase subunit BcsC [compost metagenome]